MSAAPHDYSFMASAVRKALRFANGARFTARTMTEKLGCDPGPFGEPSGAMMNVIAILTKLVARGDAQWEMPAPGRPDITYRIEPPRDV